MYGFIKGERQAKEENEFTGSRFQSAMQKLVYVNIWSSAISRTDTSCTYMYVHVHTYICDQLWENKAYGFCYQWNLPMLGFVSV